MRDADSQDTGAPNPGRPSRVPDFPRLPLELSAGTNSLGAILKLLFYALLIAATVYLLWKNRKNIGPALARLAEELRQLWASMWGARAARTDLEVASMPVERPRRFADFADPFATGTAGRMAPDVLIAHTLAAFEAWAREHGHPRRDNQTPRELVRRAVPPDSPMGDVALLLAELHSQVAYSASGPSTKRVAPLEQLWRHMRSSRPQEAANEAYHPV
jgi:hypothetical protein